MSKGSSGVVRGNLWPGEFRDLLRKLNPRLEIFRGNRDGKSHLASVRFWERTFDPLGLFEYASEGNWRPICACSTDWIPERTIFGEDGRILKRGWREVLDILEKKSIIRIPRELGGGQRGLVLKWGVPQKVSDDGALVPQVA